MEEYLKVNRESWNKRTEIHVKSDFYDQESFEKGRSSLNEIELNLLGNISGKSILHLQCHFGQDTLSLARMGASVTGVDISDKSIDFAKDTAKKLSIESEFVCCNVLDIDKYITGSYDIVFTSYGTIGWLPELSLWGKLINQFLKPGGSLILVEFHPMIWMFDDELNDIAHSYFNRGAIVEEYEGTYADPDSKVKIKAYGWNHPLSEVFKSLHDVGLVVTHFNEYDYSPYNCFSKTVKTENGYQIKGFEGKLPMVYSLKVEKADIK
ncbi:class I SAM-dependent methyltransferase [Bacteroidota bacterium]